MDFIKKYFSRSLKVVEDGYEFFAKRQLVTLFSAPNYCGEFDNAGGMMTVDESLLCSFQVIYQQKKNFFSSEIMIFVIFPFVDIETIGKESEISVQFDK